MRRPPWRIGLAGSVAVVALTAFAAVFAQDDDEQEQEQPDEQEAIEEIVVTAGKRGDPVDIEAQYEAQLQEMLFRDMERLRVLEEEYKWRREEPNVLEGPSRFKWGYDPKSELEMRRQTDLMDLQFDDATRPASLVRFEF